VAVSESRASARLRHWLRLLTPLALVALIAAACASTPRPSAKAAATTTTTTSRARHHRSTPAETTSAAAAGCERGPLGVSRVTLYQTMSGRIEGCLRVGELSPGTYHVRLDGVLLSQGSITKAAAAGSGEPKVTSLTLAPRAGAPGTTVTVTGTLAEPLQKPNTHIDLCFDGCRDGLDYSGVQATWTSGRTFKASIVVPDAPWVERDPTRVVVPKTGSVPIGVRCLSADAPGCGLLGAVATASFHLKVHHSPISATIQGYARLRATPSAARPGDILRISGFAPLASVIGSDDPFISQFHVASGAGTGPEVRFVKHAKGLGSTEFFRFGHATFKVQAAPAFASLRHTQAVGQPIEDALSPVAAVGGGGSSAPSETAWCEPGAVQVSGSATTHVSRTFPTTEAVAELTKAELAPYPPVGHDDAACVGVALAAGHPHFALAVFLVNPHDTAPPFGLVAMETTDGGATWTPIPVPTGAAETTFGGVRATGSKVVAIFASARDLSSSAPLAEVTTDGGRRWHPSSLACPTEGPCVTFGPYRPGNCAMNGSTQALLRSGNNGSSWTSVAWPSFVESCDPAELVPTGPKRALLANSGSGYLLEQTSDGGQTWSTVGVPEIPGHQEGMGFSPFQGGLVVLSDASLLGWRTHDGAEPTTSWYLLEARSSSWCPLEHVLPTGGEVKATPEPIGNELWWAATPASNQATNEGVEVVHEVAMSALHC